MMLLVPLLHGGLSVVTTTPVEVLGLRSANPLGAGNVVRSTIRKRSRLKLPPLLFTSFRRTSNVPNVELLAGSEVKSRTMFGGEFFGEH